MDTITAQRIRLEKIAMKHLEAREYPLGGTTPIYDELMTNKPSQGSAPMPFLWARVREWLRWI